MASPTTGVASDGLAPAVAADASWFGHPRPLARLFTVELWERFGFYGMRALLVLYLTKHFVFPDETAGAMYGAYMSLVYLTPVIGGLIADQYLGAKRSVKFGALVMALGYGVLCFGGEQARAYAEFDGVRHAVLVAPGTTKGRFLVDNGQRLQIAGRDDGSVDLKRPDGSVARTIAKAEFHGGAERSPMFVAIMLAALSAIVIGNGFFKPNVSTMVGGLYAPDDPRRDGGFSIFYMGINLGAIGSQLLTAPVADAYGWGAGFALAAVGMLISWARVQFGAGALAGLGEPPAKRAGRPDPLLWIALGTAAAIGVAYLLFQNTLAAQGGDGAGGGQGIVAYLLGLPVLGKLLFVMFLAAVIVIPIWSARVGTKTERDMMWAATVLVIFNVMFWTLFEQAGSSLTLFADRNTDRSIFGLFTISAPQIQFFNSFFVVLLAPVFTGMWGALRRRGLEPGIPAKFALGIMGVGAGYLVLVAGAAFAGTDSRVSIWWLALLYFVHTAAELSISPVGLSMITKLSIARVVGMMMGVWFLSIAVAEYVGGIVAQVASVATVGGEVTNLAVSLHTYTQTFSRIGWAAVIFGAVLLLVAVPLKRWMHGIT